MKENLKMNTLLAKVDHSTASFKKLVSDYAKFFRDKQGMFRGFKKTYTPRDGYFEDPSKTGLSVVATTVDEKFDWFNVQFKAWLKDVFSVESTNSAGANRVELKVDNVSFGKLTATELMRLKNVLLDKDFEAMLANIPVRSDSEVWNPTDDPEYEGRAIFQTDLVKGVARTTEKEEVILKDPNLDPAHLPANYIAKSTIKSKMVEIGDYTQQYFTGEWTQRQRAELLRRRSQLLAAVIEALKEVNDNYVEEPSLDVDKFVDFLYKG